MRGKYNNIFLCYLFFNNMIKINNLHFTYHKESENPKKALTAVSLSIKEGEFVSIIGQNGSGKTTLAKHLNAILPPTKGSVLIDGINTRNKENLWDIRKKVGMVFQNPENQIICSTVRSDISFGPENLGIDRVEIEKRVDEAIELMGLSKYQDYPPHMLSIGLKQKVTIAGVLAMGTKYIIFDEPTSMLDPLGKKEVFEVILNLRKKREVTIIYITHLMEEVLKSDRAIVMSEGKIVLDDSPKKIFSKLKILRSLSLDVPIIPDISSRLNKRGISIPSQIITTQELVNCLKQL